MEGKFCRVLHNDSSTIIQTTSGQTVYECLSKIFIKKKIPWYKCDIYFHYEFNVTIINFKDLRDWHTEKVWPPLKKKI